MSVPSGTPGPSLAHWSASCWGSQSLGGAWNSPLISRLLQPLIPPPPAASQTPSSAPKFQGSPKLERATLTKSHPCLVPPAQARECPCAPGPARLCAAKASRPGGHQAPHSQAGEEMALVAGPVGGQVGRGPAHRANGPGTSPPAAIAKAAPPVPPAPVHLPTLQTKTSERVPARVGLLGLRNRLVPLGSGPSARGGSIECRRIVLACLACLRGRLPLDMGAPLGGEIVEGVGQIWQGGLCTPQYKRARLV